MSRRASWVLGVVVAASLAAAACGKQVATTANVGFCDLISRAALEQAYGPMLNIRSDRGPVNGNDVHGSCDYLLDRSNTLRVFFTVNVNSDPDRLSFEKLIADPMSKKISSSHSEIYEIEGGMLRLIGHKSSVTIEVGLRVGSDVADGPRDEALALQLLEEALSHY